MSVRTVLLVLVAGLCLIIAAAAGSRITLGKGRSRLERNKAVVRRMHAAVWSEANREKAVAAVRQLYTPDFIVHDWTGDHRPGVDGLIQNWESERASFVGLTEHAQAIVAEGDLVVDRFFSTGTQARDLGPIPHHSPGISNRGRTLNMSEMEMFRLVDGKLAEQWLLNDIWGAHAQLGLFDPDHWRESICGALPK